MCYACPSRSRVPFTLTVQRHAALSCLATMSTMSFSNGHIAFLFFAFSISLAFLWYHSYKDSRTRSSHSTPQPPPSPDSESGHDMASVVRQSTIPPGNGAPPITSTNEQCRAVRVPQPYDAFLVLDVEATCLPGTDFHWPNEIIVRYRAVARSLA